MKIKVIFFVLFIVGNVPLWGQVDIKIDSIIFNHVIEARSKDLLVSPWGVGPIVAMRVSVTNSSHDEIRFKRHDDYQLYCVYEYNGISGKSMDLYLTIDDEHPLVIPPDSTYTETIDACLFLPYEIIEFTDIVVCDHSHVINEVISSLKMVLKIGGGKYESNHILSASIGSQFFYESKWNDD